MKNLVIIVAVGRNLEIGANNDLLWRFREDLQNFRDVTMGHYVVMGLNTYRSMPPSLEGRKYIVISESKVDDEAVMTFGDLDAFLDFARGTGETIFVIGGGMIYSQLIGHCNKMILTEIDAEAPDAHVFFPNFDRAQWRIECIGEFVSPCGVAYKRNVYTR